MRKQTTLLLAGSKSSSGSELLGKRLGRCHRLFTAPTPNGHGLERLAVAPDDDVGHLVELRVADPAADRLLALVDVDAKAVSP